MKNCPYKIRIRDFDWRIHLCKIHKCSPVHYPEFTEDCHVYKEYNTDTSARHPMKDDDIVRAISNKEDIELQNKESVK